MEAILLGVSDGISAYKAADITSQLAKLGCNVEILMIKSGTTFITSLTLQSLSKNPVHTGIMVEIDPSKTDHVELAKKADLLLVMPALANTIRELAHGVADDLLSAVALTLYPETPKIIAPATNTYMYQNPIVQRNIGTLREVGYQEMIPYEALLACDDYDRGALTAAEGILQAVMRILAPDNKEQFMSNTKKFTLTAMFLAILPLLALTPLGFITLGPSDSTTMHVPIIIGSVVLGPKIGSMLDGTFRIISLIKNTTAPTPLPFIFSPFIPVIGTDHGSWKALLIVLIPQILIGVAPYFTYRWLNKLTKGKAQPVSLFATGVLDSTTSTVLVMNMIYFLFNSAYAEIIGKAGTAVYLATIATIFSSGVSEAFIAGVAASAIASALLRLIKRNATQKL